MVNLVKVGFLGRLGSIGGNLLSPIFGPLITTLVNMFGGDSAGVAIRNSTATMRVYDSVAGSILKDVAINEHRPEGHRVVENLLSYPDDFSNAAWIKSGTLTSGVSDPDGGNTAFNYSSAVVADIQQQPSGVSGNIYCSSIFVRLASGVASISIYGADTSLTPVTLTSSWQRFYVKKTSTGTAMGGLRLYPTGLASIDVYHPQSEDVTGLSNQNPSEYVGGTGAGPFRQVFTTENANTVAGNVVTEATGNPLFPVSIKDGGMPWNETYPDRS